LTELTASVQNIYFDFRYFCIDPRTNICYCTCGLARRVAATLIREQQPALFAERKWIERFSFFAHNPAMLGFAVEQACLTHLSNHGFSHNSVQWDGVPATLFSELLPALSQKSSSTFLVPKAPTFEYIDAIHISVDNKALTVSITPIQITINPKHPDSETDFYTKFWGSIQKFFPDFTLSSTFLWIVEENRNFHEVEEQSRTLRSGSHVIVPRHTSMSITIGDLSKDIGTQLRNARREQLKPNKPKLPLSHETEGEFENSLLSGKRKLGSIGVDTERKVEEDSHHHLSIAAPKKPKT
jgi:hypothetical protein